MTRLDCVLSDARWRVLEDAPAKKRRLNPDRVQRPDVRKLNGGSRGGDERRGRGVIIVAGRDKRDRAFMMRVLRIRMDALVQLRGNREDERAGKRDDQSAASEVSPHCDATLPPVLTLRKSFL